MSEHYAFNVAPESLGVFVNKANQFDSLGGNQIKLMEKVGDCYLVVIARNTSYPYIINELKAIPGVTFCRER